MKSILLFLLLGICYSVLSQSDCIDPSSLNYNPSALLDCSGVEGGADYSCCAYYSPCQTTCSPNYNPEISIMDCAGVIGGSDASCCSFEAVNSRCCYPNSVEEGVEINWNNDLAATSDYLCSESLVYDLWFEFIPAESGIYAISTASTQFATSFSVWLGTCLQDDFYSIHCQSNNELFSPAFSTLTMEAGEIYLIQLGANSNSPFFTLHGNGTLLVELVEEEDFGCMHPFACNYNSEATIHDSSCVFSGDECSEFPEYYSSYYDSGCNCIEVLMGDYSEDGYITVDDLGSLLADFGSMDLEDYSPGDFNQDNAITVADISGFLGVFGQILPQ
ncbi:MAG: hypothetical protein AB8B53_12535 [Flavobacteriales bacterium]